MTVWDLSSPRQLSNYVFFLELPGTSTLSLSRVWRPMASALKYFHNHRSLKYERDSTNQSETYRHVLPKIASTCRPPSFLFFFKATRISQKSCAQKWDMNDKCDLFTDAPLQNGYQLISSGRLFDTRRFWTHTCAPTYTYARTYTCFPPSIMHYLITVTSPISQRDTRVIISNM